MRKILFVLLFIVCVIAGAFSYRYFSAPEADPLDAYKITEMESGFIYPQPQVLNDFELVDQDEQAFTKDSLKSRWTFVYSGFTNCPDICPTTLAELKKTYKILSDKGIADKVTVVLVSVDPGRDTPEKLKQYIHYFNPDFKAATGTEEALLGFTKQINVVYTPITDEDKANKNYNVDHSSQVVLLNPDADMVAVFTSPQKGEVMGQDFIKHFMSQ